MRLLVLFIFTVVLVTLPSFGQSKTGNLSLAVLVETERAFAKSSVESGIREAFLKFFANDGIVFRPHPVVYKEAVKNVPLPQNPKAVTLNWEPIYAAVSEAGDLGYTTGPYTLTDNSPERRPEQYGYFFSIWKKQLDGNWRVVLDLGIQNSEAYRGPRTPELAQTILRKPTESNVIMEDERKTLIGAERELLKSVQQRGVLMGFLNHLDNGTRLYRQGVQPIVGAESVRAYLSKKTFTETWEPMKADVAHSADLGYTYGSYEMREKSSEATRLEKGYYARVWKRDAKGQWKVVFDVTSPLPPEAPRTRQ